MMKCPICGKDYQKGWRAVHAHMMKDHLSEYRAKGCKLSAYGIDIKADPGPQAKPKQKTGTSKPAPKNKPAKQIKPKAPPDDFRPLDKSDPDEREAFGEGYRYYSDGAAYTAAECRSRGWM